MNIIVIYGDGTARDFYNGPGCRVSYIKASGPEGHIYRPGPHDLMFLAHVLQGATPAPGMQLWNGETIPALWEVLHPSTLQVAQAITRGEIPTVLILEQPAVWYSVMLEHVFQQSPTHATVRVIHKVYETLACLSERVHIILLAEYEPIADRSGVSLSHIPELPAGLRELLTHSINVLQGEASMSRPQLYSLLNLPYSDELVPAVAPEQPAKTEQPAQPAKLVQPAKPTPSAQPAQSAEPTIPADAPAAQPTAAPRRVPARRVPVNNNGGVS